MKAKNVLSKIGIGKDLLKSKYKSLRSALEQRKLYCTLDRYPFYLVAARYLPLEKNRIIIDIGCGIGGFTEALGIHTKYNNVFLLDGNDETIEILKAKFNNTILYKAPAELPFENSTVSYIHCSHLIEHLRNEELYNFLKVIDRVLMRNGIFVVSTPMLWSGFYDELNHVRPYSPYVLFNYLCGYGENLSAKTISEKYSEVERVYRYNTVDFYEGWGTNLFCFDFIIQVLKRVLSKIGIKKYIKNGYTLILKKN